MIEQEMSFVNVLIEDKRAELISRQKRGKNYAPWNQMFGKNRYERRLKSRISNSVRNYNKIDMNKLFKDDILTVDIQVHGETNDYLVKFTFNGVLERLQDEMEKLNTEVVDIRVLSRALTRSFNDKDVYMSCSCPDWHYRFSYWATRNDINSGAPEMLPADITNPNDDKGPGCKHAALCLTNTVWVLKVASVIRNYINYMEKHYNRLFADIIYPAVYGKQYTKPTQLDMFDDKLSGSEDELDTANKWAKTRGQWQKGNEFRFTPTKNTYDDQISFDDTEDVEEV